MDPDAVEMLQCAGNTQRTYRNRTTGQIVNMFMIVGPPGPTAVHTPEICYSSRDYDRIEPRQRAQIRESQLPDESFWETVFRANDLRADVLHVWYSWNDGNGWRAADNPRFAFARHPFLYKLQLAATAGPTSTALPTTRAEVSCKTFYLLWTQQCSTSHQKVIRTRTHDLQLH